MLIKVRIPILNESNKVDYVDFYFDTDTSLTKDEVVSYLSGCYDKEINECLHSINSIEDEEWPVIGMRNNYANANVDRFDFEDFEILEMWVINPIKV